MSLILKGIDMPKCSNEDIVVVIRRDKAEVWQTGVKERTVEAIQIDRPHGRLIDADKIMKDLEEWKLNPNNDDEAVVFVNHFQGIIRTEPTILEAEE